jgi:hypothetical protein
MEHVAFSYVHAVKEVAKLFAKRDHFRFRMIIATPEPARLTSLYRL